MSNRQGGGYNSSSGYGHDWQAQPYSARRQGSSTSQGQSANTQHWREQGQPQPTFPNSNAYQHYPPQVAHYPVTTTHVSSPPMSAYQQPTLANVPNIPGGNGNQSQEYGYPWPVNSSRYEYPPTNIYSHDKNALGRSSNAGDLPKSNAQNDRNHYVPRQPSGPHTLSPSPLTTSSPGSEMVHCPYNCGTVLTGVHAAGNLTRHLKSQTCTGSSKPKEKYVCPVEGCHKDYTRSDGLRVHMRRRHGEMSSGYSPGDSSYYQA